MYRLLIVLVVLFSPVTTICAKNTSDYVSSAAYYKSVTFKAITSIIKKKNPEIPERDLEIGLAAISECVDGYLVTVAGAMSTFEKHELNTPEEVSISKMSVVYAFSQLCAKEIFKPRPL